jgi:hypothetical protein
MIIVIGLDSSSIKGGNFYTKVLLNLISILDGTSSIKYGFLFVIVRENGYWEDFYPSLIQTIKVCTPTSLNPIGANFIV